MTKRWYKYVPRILLIPAFRLVSLIWAMSQENLSSGFATRYDTNWSPLLQRLARGLNFSIYKQEVLYYLSSEQQRRWSDCAEAQADLSEQQRRWSDCTEAQADLRLCCLHMAKQVFSWRGSIIFIFALETKWRTNVTIKQKYQRPALDRFAGVCSKHYLWHVKREIF